MRVKSEARRQAIIDVAKEAFCRQGFEATSMSEIASRVGGSKATLYNYFRSKEEIFIAVMESSATERIAEAFKILEENTDIRFTLVDFGMHYLKSIISPDIVAIRRMAINEAERSDIGRHFYENGPKKGWLLLNHYLQKQVGQNVLVPCDVWVCAMHLKALLESEIVEQHALGVIKEIDDTQLKNVVTRAVSVFLKAYQTQDKNSAE
jgi:Transcriptional regulator